MSIATATTVTVTFDPNAINLQSDVIGPATSTSAGLLTAALYNLIQSLSGSGLTPAVVTDLVNMLSIFTADGGPKVFSAVARPPANDPQFSDAIVAGYVAVIWNSTDRQPNYSDGTNWYDAAGNLT
jgi:hypothetical protein